MLVVKAAQRMTSSCCSSTLTIFCWAAVVAVWEGGGGVRGVSRGAAVVAERAPAALHTLLAA